MAANLKPPPLNKGNRDVAIPPTVKDKPYTDVKANTNKARGDFKIEEFERLIGQKGYFCTWRKAMLCTCQSPETEQALLTCDTCDGSGYFYIHPIDVQVIMSNMDKATDVYRQPGEWVTATANASVMPEFRLGYRDSLVMLDSVMVYSEWITKGNRKGLRVKLPAGVDSARYKIVTINALFYRDPVTSTPKALTETIDYKVTSDGWIEWQAGAASIPDGTNLTIHYEYHPIWIVTTTPHAVRDTVVKFKSEKQTVRAMPLQCKVSLDFVLDSSSADAAAGGAG